MIGSILLVFAALCLADAFFLEPRTLRLTKRETPVRDLPKSFDGVRILHLSDLHENRFGKQNQRLAKLVKKTNPDYIFATGDFLYKKDGKGKPFLELLESLEGRYPVFFSLGNHESWSRMLDCGSFSRYIREIQKKGATVLDDSSVLVERSRDSLRIYGLTPERSIHYESVIMDLSAVRRKLGSCDPDHPSILMAHEPSGFSAYAEWGANAVFSGHIHGGVIRLPLIGGLFSPDRWLFPKYQSGLYHEKGSVMYVSRGLGNSHVQLRFLNLPEAALITLRKG